MNPRAFLELAKRLLVNENNPEGLRSTLSRAYYAAFNVAAEFLGGIGCGIPLDATGHTKAYHYLNNCGDSVLVEAGVDLNNLRGQRNDADYKMNNRGVEREEVVRSWLDVAERIIQR